MTTDPQANSHAGRHGPIEVFWTYGGEQATPWQGWYWWRDGSTPVGPFSTSRDAYDAWQRRVATYAGYGLTA